MAPAYCVRWQLHRLDYHLRRVPAILLCDEEAGYFSRRAPVAIAIPTIHSLDLPHFFHHSTPSKWLYYISSWPVSRIYIITDHHVPNIINRWNLTTFISSYINIVVVLCLYISYKLIKKTSIVPLAEIPIRDFIEQARQSPDDPEKKHKNKMVKWASFLWS